jgi:hypothetical protein
MFLANWESCLEKENDKHFLLVLAQDKELI